MSNEVATYLKYANLQMAAEALFVRGIGRPTVKIGAQFKCPVLTTATNVPASSLKCKRTSSSKTGQSSSTSATPPPASPARCWSQRGQTGGELVLSFRSTEFADDAARDNQATNVMEIKAEGFAFGQIADMEQWFAELKSSGKLDPGVSVTVTGYSLGGHLATAFNLLHGNDLTAFGAPLIAATYTFNGAGVGTVTSGGTLAQVMADFTRHRALGSNADLFTDADVRARYDRLKDIFQEGAQVTLAQVDQEMRSLAQQGLAKVGDLILYKTLDRIRSVVYEAERIKAGVPSGTAGAAALPVSMTDIAAIGLDYQLAVRRAAEKTAGYRTDVISGGIDALAGRNLAPGGALANFYDLYGASPPSAVANSQIPLRHRRFAISIEDQPLFRGTVIANVGTTSWKAGEAKLLVDNFGLNDFGDTHSLVLIVDSLSVQNTLAQLDPDISQGTLDAILAAASNKESLATIGTQGKAEGDTLEKIIKSLATMLGVSIQPMAAKLEGGTWANEADRAVLHGNLKAIADSIATWASKARRSCAPPVPI